MSPKDLPKHSNIVKHIFTSKVWLFFIASSGICIIILMRILDQPASLAAVEFARMLASASTLKKPRTSHGRILLITLIVASLTINTFLSSCLSAVSTVSSRIPTTDSAEDLMNSNLSIYGTTGYKDIILRTEIRNLYREIGAFKECADRLLRGDKVACIEESWILRFFLYENATVHVSENYLVSRAYAQVFPENSPLRFKFTKV